MASATTVAWVTDEGSVAAGRLRLLTWATADNRLVYLAILRAFDRAHGRGDRPQGLHPEEVSAELAAAGEPEDGDVDAALEALWGWGVLAKDYDAAAVRTIADYRRKRSVYALTELGYLAYRLVEDLVSAAPAGAELKRLALSSLHRSLLELAAAVGRRDAVEVANLLDRLHRDIADLAERAERFYRRLADDARTTVDDPATFLARKDLLVQHITDFHAELAAHRPRLAAAVAKVREVGGDEAVVELACEADRAVHITPEERRRRWADAWAGIVGWFVGTADQRATAALLEDRTVAAIAETTTLLRRILARRGGRGRQAQLRHLAAWVAGCSDDADAHALVGAALGLHVPRTLGGLPADPDACRPSTPWAVGDPAVVAGTFRNRGLVSSPGRPQPIRDDVLARRRLATEAARSRQAERQAVEALASLPAPTEPGALVGRRLDRAELAILLRLLDRALASRAVVEGRLGRGRATEGPLTLLVIPDAAASSCVATADGDLVLEGARLERAVP